jgi:hypothetical protein
MEVSVQVYTVAVFLPEKRPPVPIGQEAEWAPRAGLDVVAKRKKKILSLTPPGIET